MSWFPVVADEIAATEAALGIALPPRYKQLLDDPRVQRLLAHPVLGVLAAEMSMREFVDIGRRLKAELPGFPDAGVIACATPGRYRRFWLPDRKRPDTLGELIHVWDSERRRQPKDCTNEACIASMIDLLHRAEPALLAEVGYPPPRLAADAALLRVTQPCAPVHSLLALRGDAARTAVVRRAGQWQACASLQIKGRWLLPCDLARVPDGAADWALKIAPGHYRVDGQIAMSTRGDWPIVAAVRVVLDGCHVETARHVSTLDVDTAGVSLHDRQTFLRQVPPGDREACADELLALEGLPCVITAGRKAEAFLVRSGDGDGSYPVFELRAGERVVGLEIRFAAAA